MLKWSVSIVYCAVRTRSQLQCCAVDQVPATVLCCTDQVPATVLCCRPGPCYSAVLQTRSQLQCCAVDQVPATVLWPGRSQLQCCAVRTPSYSAVPYGPGPSYSAVLYGRFCSWKTSLLRVYNVLRLHFCGLNFSRNMNKPPVCTVLYYTNSPTLMVRG